MANNERPNPPAARPAANGTGAGQGSNAARRRRRRRGSGSGPRPQEGNSAATPQQAAPQQSRNDRRPRPTGQGRPNAPQTEPRENRTPNAPRTPRQSAPQGESQNRARTPQGAQRPRRPAQNSGAAPVRNSNPSTPPRSREQRAPAPQRSNPPVPNSSTLRGEQRRRGPVRAVPEEPGLPLITRRPPKQKFQNFEEYMAAHGGVTAPIEGEELPVAIVAEAVPAPVAEQGTKAMPGENE